MEGEFLPQFLRMIAALVFVLGLIGGLALLVKKFGLNEAITHTKNKKRRLKVVETLPLDGRRKLVLIERDNVQHLILLGGNTESTIETGIAPVDNETHD